MQSPSDHFLRAINTDFDRIIAMCKNWQVLGLIVNLRLKGRSDFFFCFFFWVVFVFLWDLLFYIIYFYTCALMGFKAIYHTINFSRMLFSRVLEYIDCM